MIAGMLVVISSSRAAPPAGSGIFPVYRIINLGTLGGNASGASALNAHGQVVGWSKTNTGVRHAFLHSNGVMTDLGTLPGGSESTATGINDRGQVVGYGGINEYGDQFVERSQAFIWDNAIIRSLGALYCPCTFNVRYGTSVAQDINNGGIASGWSETVRGTRVYHALRWDNRNGLQDIGGGPGNWSISRAYAISNNGSVVGDYARDAGMMSAYNRTAVRWRGDNMVELGELDGHTSSTARDINEAGQIVGWSWTDTGADTELVRAVMWDGNDVHDLGVLPGDTASRAEGINRTGEVVGWSGTPDKTMSRAFIWVNGRMLDLNEVLLDRKGWILTEANAINDAGQIAGTGLYAGRPRAFLLQPVQIPLVRLNLLRSILNLNRAGLQFR